MFQNCILIVHVKASSVQVRSNHPAGRPRSSFNDVASVTAKIVASFDLTENHDVGNGRNRGKTGIVLKRLGKIGIVLTGKLVLRQGSGSYSKTQQRRGEADQVRRTIPELLLSWHHPVSGQKQRTEHARLGHVPPSSLSDSYALHPLPSLPSPDPANPSNTHSSICQLLLLTCNVAKEVGTCCHERLLVMRLNQGTFKCPPARQHYHGR